MPEHAHRAGQFADLDGEAATAYRLAVEIGYYCQDRIAARSGLTRTQTARAQHTLTALRLLHPAPEDPGTLIPVNPDAAAADLTAPAEMHIRELKQSLTEVRTRMQTLAPTYQQARRRRSRTEPVDVISDPGTLQAVHAQWAEQCTEVLAAHPGGPQPPHLIDAARPTTLDQLRRDARVKHLYQHTMRNDLATASYANTITAAGAQVRTTDRLIDRMTIYDRELAVIPEQNAASAAPGAAVIREPTVVAFLCKVYDHLWDDATAYTPATPSTSPADDPGDQLKQAIIKFLAQGHKDETIARQLGMSVRTCRRHISQLMRETHSTSRFQAGHTIALAGRGSARPGQGPTDGPGPAGGPSPTGGPGAPGRPGDPA